MGTIIMETRFWWQVRKILDFREVLKFKNIKKNCNSYLSKSSRKFKKMPSHSGLFIYEFVQLIPLHHLQWVLLVFLSIV